MRVLALDIETSPNVAFTWGLWDQNVALSQLVSTSETLCFAAKWLDAKRMFFYSTHKHGKAAMVAEAHALLDEADVVLHYNGSRFDIPHLNREFVEAGLTPPSPFREIDLFLTVKRRFRFQSNKLEHVSRQLGLPGKLAHEGFDLWRKCLAGDPAAWRRMEKYNRQDVVLLEELYQILQPWVVNHPNRALHDARPDACPRCGSAGMIVRGYYHTQTGRYTKLRCKDCGGYARGRTSLPAGVKSVVIT